MPLTCSMVEESQNKGAISTRPPMATVMRMPISRRIELFSRILCLDQSIPRPRLLGRHGAELRRRSDARLLGRVDRLIAANSPPHIVGHEQRADQEQQPADGPDDIEGMHRLDGLDEGIF